MSDTRFKPGNPGRPPGIKNARTLQWEALGEAITGQHCERFNEFMNSLWNGDFDDQMAAADLYLKTLEYFKPKQARQIVTGESENPVQIIISDSI